MSLFSNLFGSPITLTQAKEELALTDFFLPENSLALRELLRFEVSEAGGENILFLVLEQAYRKKPSLDAVGHLKSTFVGESAPLQINCSVHEIIAVENKIKQFYSSRRQVGSLSQVHALKPPFDLFEAVKKAADLNAADVLSRFRYRTQKKSGNKRSVSVVDLNAGDSQQLSGRAKMLQAIREHGIVAMRLGLPVPSWLCSLS